MVVQIDPSRTVQGDSREQHNTGDGEPGEHRNQPGDARCDHEGQPHSVEWSEHAMELRST